MRNLNSVPSLFSKIRTLTTIKRDATKPLATLLPKAGNAINHFDATEKQVCSWILLYRLAHIGTPDVITSTILVREL